MSNIVEDKRCLAMGKAMDDNEEDAEGEDG